MNEAELRSSGQTRRSFFPTAARFALTIGHGRNHPAEQLPEVTLRTSARSSARSEVRTADVRARTIRTEAR
jgi:hypothetical protein